jgi:hypothetical protein
MSSSAFRSRTTVPIEAPASPRLSDDHLANAPGGEELVGNCREVDLPPGPVAVGSAVPVQQVDDGIATRAVGCVAWRQIDGDIAIR